MPEGDEDSDSGTYGHNNYKGSLFFFFYGYISESQYLGNFLTIDEDSEYIEETREVEIERTNKAARSVQQSIMQEL